MYWASRSTVDRTSGLSLPTMERRLAMDSGPALRTRAAVGAETAQHLFRRDRQLVDTHADRVEDRIGNGGKYRIGAHLAWPLAAIGPVGRRALEDRDVVGRDISRARHEVAVEVDRPVVAIRAVGCGGLPGCRSGERR